MDALLLPPLPPLRESVSRAELAAYSRLTAQFGLSLSAARALSRRLGLREPAAQDYLDNLAAGLWPRLNAALTHGTLNGVFV